MKVNARSTNPLVLRQPQTFKALASGLELKDQLIPNDSTRSFWEKELLELLLLNALRYKIEKGLSIIAGCTVYSSCLVCKLLCNHGFRVISSLIDAFARSSTSGSLCCRVTCLCICISADTAGQRRWILAFHEQASVGTTRLKPTFSFLLWSSVFNLLLFFF